MRDVEPPSVEPPSDEAGELEWRCYEQAGVLTTAQAKSLLKPSKVRHLVASGRWRPVCRGVLVAGTERLTRWQQLWVAVLAAGPGAVLAGATAVTQGGVRGLRRDPIYVLIPATRAKTSLVRQISPELPGLVIHHTSYLPPEHRQLDRPMRTTTGRGVVDAVAWAASDNEARTVIAAACQQRRTSAEEILAVAQTRPRTRRRGLLLETLADVAGGAEALSELDFVKLCRRFRLPPPDLQERRTDGSGRTRFLDAYWRQWRLHVEVDGAHHMEVRHWEADMLRQNDVWIQGDRILRFPAWLARRQPAVIADQLRKALKAAGWPGP